MGDVSIEKLFIILIQTLSSILDVVWWTSKLCTILPCTMSLAYLRMPHLLLYLQNTCTYPLDPLLSIVTSLLNSALVGCYLVVNTTTPLEDYNKLLSLVIIMLLIVFIFNYISISRSYNTK